MWSLLKPSAGLVYRGVSPKWNNAQNHGQVLYGVLQVAHLM